MRRVKIKISLQRKKATEKKTKNKKSDESEEESEEEARPKTRSKLMATKKRPTRKLPSRAKSNTVKTKSAKRKRSTSSSDSTSVSKKFKFTDPSKLTVQQIKQAMTANNLHEHLPSYRANKHVYIDAYLAHMPREEKK